MIKMHLSNISPLSYQEWSNDQGVFGDTSQTKYLAYLNSWYQTNNKRMLASNVDANIKSQYIQLIQDLTFLFNSDERDLFLSQIDFNNKDDLIYVIPYLANKLKQITQLLNEKREALKQSKTKHSLIGSVKGLEDVLYDYILNNFTKKPYSYTNVPLSPLANFFPELSSLNGNFFIEIEELYDKGSYHDSDPSVPINDYLDISSISDLTPFDNLTNDEINALLSTRFLSRIAASPLSVIFNQYLTTIPTLSNLSNTNNITVFNNLGLSNSYTLSTVNYNLPAFYTTEISNLLNANNRYLGENVYGLTAVTVKQANIPSEVLNLDFATGNNWFYWPSGDKIVNDSFIGNLYQPIQLVNSNLINCITSLYGPLTSTNYLNSDLIFTNKNGVIEGAWLQGIINQSVDATMSVNLNSKETKSFLYPYAGFDIDPKTMNFKGYNLTDYKNGLYNSLEPNIQKNLLNTYYTSTLPNSASNDIYLNQSTLIYSGANAGKSSDQADTITKKIYNNQVNTTYSDSSLTATEQAFLFKFDKTDLLIENGTNNILWPLTKYDPKNSNLPITVTSDTCLPVKLGSIDLNTSMLGAVAGLDFNTADIIYKITDQSGVRNIEAAWLASGQVSNLDTNANAISVYSTPATHCAQYIDGPIQNALSFYCDAGDYVSFVWCDKDTPANEVFYYKNHSSECPYGKSYPHDYYVNQDYQNKTPLNFNKTFPLKAYPCTCKAVNYSPLGTQGKGVDDYNGMADLLFADPFGFGKNFKINSWYDTRGLNVYNSPQFSFYQIDGTKDKEVGFGTGTWVTGNNSPMILKTGRCYTYKRSSLRNNTESVSQAPFLVNYYPYRNISVSAPSLSSNIVDLVILIDNSRTQSLNLNFVKSLAIEFCQKAIYKNPDILISVISFARNRNLLNYLTNDINSITNYINDIPNLMDVSNYLEFQTDISDAFALAYNILYVTEPYNNLCDINNKAGLCNDLNTQLINASFLPNISNCPRSNATKRILIFSDGQENINVGETLPYVQNLKSKGVSIMSMNIGDFSASNNLMQNLASDGFYFNLQDYLKNNDGDLNNFIEYVTLQLLGRFPYIPIWCKAISDENGNWSGLDVPSDMVLYAGDYVQYIHRPSISYTIKNNNTSFTINSLSFAFTVKLNGWNYDTSTFNDSWIGYKYGAKPFWGKSYVDFDSVDYFNKETISFGGQVRILGGYVPIMQPDISDMVLTNGSYIEYYNFGSDNIFWEQNLNFDITIYQPQWNKLTFIKEPSNLEFILNDPNAINLNVISTNIPSDIILEGYSEFNPAKYNYYARNAFKYTENLYNFNICEDSFVVFLTGQTIAATKPYANLSNINYPTVATVSFPSLATSVKDTGWYFTPDKFGVSYYRGKGYTIEVDPKSLSKIDAVSAERMFLSPEKYGPRNRGLTKKDQISPLGIKNINNNWLMEPNNSGLASGRIIDTVANQKLVPYQSNYETNLTNDLGVSLQSDDFQFWNPNLHNTWTDQENYPLTLRKEINPDAYNQRINALLVNNGDMVNWRTDIFGNSYGLLKNINPYIITEYGVMFVTQNTIPFIIEG